MQKAFDRIIGGLLPDRGTALLAVSGGRDSVCMAELFLHSSLGLSFSVAHCNFHLRDAESDSDEALVRGWAEKNGVQFHKADFDTRAYASEHSVSTEMAARELRYIWFSRLCREYGYSCVAVAHNANDNAETLILNLLRGTGLHGLCGMKMSSEVPVTDQGLAGVRLIRPLLPFSRAQIDEYVHENCLEYHDDRTNAETLYKRNAIRHNVLPELERLNPAILETFSHEMDIFSQESGIADEYFDSSRAALELEHPENEDLRLNIKALKAAGHPEYLLYRFLSPYGFTGRALEPLIHLVLDSDTISGRTFFSRTHRILTTSGWLSVMPLTESRANGFRKFPCVGSNALNVNDADVCSVVRGVGSYIFGGRHVDVSLLPVDGDASVMARRLAGESVLAADSSSLTFPFILRCWRRGDWIRPIGLGGRKKLSDIFTDLKLSLDEKEQCAVVVIPSWNSGNGENDPEHVAAVCGYVSGRFFSRVDDNAKCSVSTVSILSISFKALS